MAVSRSGDIPEAGTVEAERALGREPAAKGREGIRLRRLSGSKGTTQKTETAFAEDAGRQA